MKVKSWLSLFFSVLLLSGCATTQVNKNPGFSTYKADLNGDGGSEVVEVEDKSVSGNGIGSEIVVYEKGKEKKIIDSIFVPGKITKVDFILLNPSVSQQQIAVYSRVEDNATNLMVYQLQNNIFSKMFDATSEYGIALNNSGIVTRIKIGKALGTGESNSPNRVNDYDSWVWTGDKFVKE